MCHSFIDDLVYSGRVAKTDATRRARGRPRRAERESGSSRKELIDAAADVFTERGLEAASVEEVIRRAGLSKGTFYFNFTGKDDLFLAVVEDRLDEPLRSLMEITATAPGETPTAATISAGLAELFRHERTTLLLLQDYWSRAARDEDLAARYRARQASLRTTLARTLEQRHEHTGVPLSIEADRLAEAFMALAQGLGLESIVDPAAVDPALFGDLLALVYDGLAARASAGNYGM
jgi:AcrR family transcriptional regulator